MSKYWIASDGTPLLRMRIFYGSDRTLGSDVKERVKLMLLDSDTEQARSQIEREFPIDDPRYAFVVVWAACLSHRDYP
jgi:hypothetical protein